MNENGCIVQLIFRETVPLGTGVVRSNNGGRFLDVTDFLPTSQAERAAIRAMLEPEMFRQAKILAVINGNDTNKNNTVRWDAQGGAMTVLQALKSPVRPKSILFWLQPRNMNSSEPYNSVKHCVGVNRIFGNAVELVFEPGKVIGIVSKAIPTTATDNPPLQVQEFLPGAEADILAQQMLLQPKDFEGATISAVNGKAYSTRNTMIRAIQNLPRPISIQFKLCAKNKPRLLEQLTAVSAQFISTTTTLPPLLPTSPTSGPLLSSTNPRRLSSLEKRDRAILASTSMRALFLEEQDNHHHAGQQRNAAAIIDQQSKNDENEPNRRGLPITESFVKRKLDQSAAIAEQLNAENEKTWSLRDEDNDNTMLLGSNRNLLEDEQDSQLAVKARAIMRRFRINGFNSQTTWRQESSSCGSSDNNNDDSCNSDTLLDGEDPEVLSKRAYEACLQFILDHFEAFVEETPNVTYEEWIEEIHPENTRMWKSKDNLLTVDHRFYVEASDHRKIWNDNLGGVRQFVPVRNFEDDDQAEFVGPCMKRSVSVEFIEDLEDIIEQDF